MPNFVESEVIAGVVVVQLQAFGDTRGRFVETFRKEWFPQRRWDIVQTNRSDSQAGVLRGLHYHHHQVDYWYCVHGRIRAGMVDLRPTSPTYMATATVEMGMENNVGLFLPVGVAHGFVALTDATLTYIVDNYYNGGRDENGVLWNDPAIGLDWGIDFDPILSNRDLENRLYADIPAENRPR